MTKPTRLNRRQLIAASGGAAAVAAAGAAEAAPKSRWDYDTDVVCVGSGAAACAAAVAAIDNGARAMIVEKMPILGGTTGKSGGVAWIANHHGLRAEGIEDKKEDALRYMARYSYPLAYNAESPTLGLEESEYKLIETFYDEGAATIDRLAELGATKFKEFRLFQVNRPAPDYADHFPENKTPTRRAMEPESGSGSSAGGASLALQLETWLRAKNAPILTDTRVTKVILENGRAIGVEAETEGRTIRIRARKGVVFGTGGYAHNEDLIRKHQIALYGACAMPGSTGDFVPIAQAIGARMGPLNTAWRTQVLLEEALDNRAIGLGAFVLPGDSMIVVNKYGKRCVNEKRGYNDRTLAHFDYNPTREEYPNHLMFMLFDQRSIDAFGGDFPFPLDAREQPYLISGATWDEVFAGVSARLEKVKGRTGGVALDAGFAANAKASIKAFNGFAKKGVDPEFERGKQLYDREWHLLFSARREGTSQPENPYPNITMHPIAKEGPFYAYILAPGALDTNGGPSINEKAQVLAANGAPIPGLYGAGNCIASPTKNAYYGAGGTIGPALTFGFIAGRNAAKEKIA
jgi:succinate dehydrogenase/fumarate reductase flavoprotein subunit